MQKPSLSFRVREENSSSHSSDFVNGFTLGILAGACGYYLFGTDEGGKMRKKIVLEWQKTREVLAEEGGVAQADLSLRHFLKNFLEKISNTTQLSLAQGDSAQKEKTQESAKKNSKISTEKKSNRRFRGV